MATAGYIFCWLAAHLLVIAVGTASHYWHAFLAMPDKVIDGYRWRDHALNKALNEDYCWWADYDEGGFWEFYSLKNYLFHVVPASLLLFLLGLAYFPERHGVVAKICGFVGQIGLKPLFCS